MSAIRLAHMFALAALLAASAAGAGGDEAQSGDAAKGKELFMTKSCVACHTVKEGDASTVGPSLFGVLGRKAGTTPSILGASENLKKFGVTWTVETLNEFLQNPDAKVPGTPMSGKLPDPQDRADVIAYLSTLK